MSGKLKTFPLAPGCTVHTSAIFIRCHTQGGKMKCHTAVFLVASRINAENLTNCSYFTAT